MALTNNQKQLLETAKKAALELGENGKALTDLIGELCLCDCLNMKWQPSDGYDAIAQNARVQIKTRKSWSTYGVNPSGRLGRFGRKAGYLFDRAIYVELDQQFEIAGIWEIDPGQIKELESMEKGSRGIHVSKFKTNARPISL